MSSASSSETTLKSLYEANDLPGAATLLKLAKETQLAVTKKQVDLFLASQAERQIFRTGRRDLYQGKVHATKANEKWVMDLIDFSELSLIHI